MQTQVFSMVIKQTPIQVVGGWKRVLASCFTLVPRQLVSAEEANCLVKLKILPDVFVPSQAE